MATVEQAIEQLKFLTEDEVRRVAAEFGTPAYVYDEATIERNARYMATLPNAFGLVVRYSLKACPTGAIIRLFDRLGLSFDASSIWEVRRAVHAGVPASKILLTAQEARFGDGLDDLLAAGLEFDAGSLRQLDAYGRARPGGRVSIRLNPGFGSGLVRRLTSGGPTSSFGIWHEDLPAAGELVRKHGLRLTRLHSHIGSGHDPEILVRAARTLLSLVPDFPDVETINLGGGYRVKALADEVEWDHGEWAEAVADEIRQVAAETGRELRLELEPGTFLMANSGSIVARVIDATSTGPDGYTFVKIDAGLTEIIRPSYYGAPHPLVSVPADGPAPEEAETYCVAGHCCIAGDVLTTERGDVERLAPVVLARTEPGDYLVIERGGGYCASMALKNFNSYPEAPEVLRRKNGAFDLIRAGQTFEQLIANERLPADLEGGNEGGTHG
jgi:diaminopimelate decarboxylase